MSSSFKYTDVILMFLDSDTSIPVESVTLTSTTGSNWTPKTTVEVAGAEPPMRAEVLDLQTQLYLKQEEVIRLREKLNAAVDVIAELQQSGHETVQDALKAATEKKVAPQHKFEWDQIYSPPEIKLTRQELYEMYNKYELLNRRNVSSFFDKINGI